jgi:hypothetical protein
MGHIPVYVPALAYKYETRQMTMARTAVVLLYQAWDATGLVDACAGNTTAAHYQQLLYASQSFAGPLAECRS